MRRCHPLPVLVALSLWLVPVLGHAAATESSTTASSAPAKAKPGQEIKARGLGRQFLDWLGPPVQSGRSMVKGYSIYAGYLMERGYGEASVWRGDQLATPRLNGFTYWERQGVISGMLMGLVATVAGAAESTMPKSVEHQDIGNIRYTTITHRSAAERRQITEEAAARGGRIASASNQSFELTVYSRNLPGGGDGTGYKLNLFFGIPMGDSMLFELGFGMGRIDAFFTDPTTNELMEIESLYVGIPLRLAWGGRWFALYGQFDWNIAGHLDAEADEGAATTHLARPFPLRVGAQSNLFGRLFVDVSAVTPSPTSLEFGWRVASGLRF